MHERAKVLLVIARDALIVTVENDRLHIPENSKNIRVIARGAEES